MVCPYAHNNNEMEGGAPRGTPLVQMKKAELYERAKKLEIKGRSKMRKADLVDAVRSKYKEIGTKMSRRGKK